MGCDGRLGQLLLHLCSTVSGWSVRCLLPHVSKGKFAQGAIEHQMRGFRRWGVMADWDSCYYTYDPQYQAGQLDVFYHMFQKVGLLGVP